MEKLTIELYGSVNSQGLLLSLMIDNNSDDPVVS